MGEQRNLVEPVPTLGHEVTLEAHDLDAVDLQCQAGARGAEQAPSSVPVKT